MRSVAAAGEGGVPTPSLHSERGNIIRVRQWLYGYLAAGVVDSAHHAEARFVGYGLGVDGRNGGELIGRRAAEHVTLHDLVQAVECRLVEDIARRESVAVRPDEGRAPLLRSRVRKRDRCPRYGYDG